MTMQSVSELTLPHLTVEAPGFNAAPMPHLDAARAAHPWLATCSFGYFVHGYQALKDLLLMDDHLHSSHDGVVQFYEADGTDWGRYMREMILGHTGPKHSRIRASVGDAFTPRNVNRQIALMRETVSTMLDEWAPKGRFDFAEFASYFPVAILCGLLGTTTDEIPRIRDTLEAQTRVYSMNMDLRDTLLDGYDLLAEYCDRLVAEREASGLNDGSLLDRLIDTRREGKIDADELRFLLMVLFPAGYDTSKNMLTLIMHQMLERPDYWERCATDLAFCGKVVEEMFRHTSVTTPLRTVVEPFDYDGIHFPLGTTLIFGVSIGGRDPNHFADAMTFDPDRSHQLRHVAFGRGAHICLGQHFAKAQITEGLHLMAQRITKPKLTGELVWRPFLGVWGLETLPIEFEPA